MKNPEGVIRSSITQLADQAHTSEPSVIRFCRKLGLSGFMELKLNLARDLPSSQQIVENVRAGDSLAEIVNKLLGSARDALTNTMNRLDLNALQGAADALASARRIEFYGVGGSGAVARDAHHKFFRLGIPSIAYDDPHMQAMSATLLGPQDVVVAISHTGSTRDLVDNAALVKKAGATLVGILGQERSPLGKLCDFALSVHSHEVATRLAPMTSRLAQLAIIDVLFVYVALHSDQPVAKRLDDVKRALVDKRY